MIVRVEIRGRFREVSVARLGSGTRHRFTIGERTLDVDVARIGRGYWSLVLPDGSQHVVAVSASPSSGLTVHLSSGDLIVGATEPRGGRRAERSEASGDAASGPARVRALMPGRVVRVLAAPGEQVRDGQGLVVVEAMKMENELRAPRAGLVTDVLVQEGSAVEAGEVLVVIE